MLVHVCTTIGLTFKTFNLSDSVYNFVKKCGHLPPPLPTP